MINGVAENQLGEDRCHFKGDEVRYTRTISKSTQQKWNEESEARKRNSTLSSLLKSIKEKLDRVEISSNVTAVLKEESCLQLHPSCFQQTEQTSSREHHCSATKEVKDKQC